MEKQKRIEPDDFENKFTRAVAVFGWTVAILCIPAFCGIIYVPMIAGNPFCGCMQMTNPTQIRIGEMLLLLSPVIGLVSAAIIAYQTILIKGIKQSTAVALTVCATSAVLILMLFVGYILLDSSYGY